MEDGRQGPPKRRRGPLIAAVLVIGLLAGGASAAYVLKPEWFKLPDLSALLKSDTATEPASDPQAPNDDTETETAGEVPSTPLDRFYKVIIETDASLCTLPPDIAASNWTEVSAFVECAKTQSVDLVSSFRYMLAQAGGRWLGSGTWSVPEGPMKVQLSSAWAHVSQLGSRWNAQASAAVKEYGSSYFGFQSHGTTGWRFAAWRCRCNLQGEFVATDTANVKPRLFITSPAQIQTEDEARQAYMHVRNFFLGPDATGNALTVEQAVTNAHLPYDLPGGLGMARPLPTKEAAQKAWEEVTALHAAVGFQVHELNWSAE